MRYSEVATLSNAQTGRGGENAFCDGAGLVRVLICYNSWGFASGGNYRHSLRYADCGGNSGCVADRDYDLLTLGIRCRDSL